MNPQKILLIVIGIALIITAGFYFYSDDDSEIIINQKAATNQTVIIEDLFCQNDSDCPDNYTCYIPIQCESDEEYCLDQLGDNTCHRNCFSNSDCVFDTKCGQVDIFVSRVRIPAQICK